MWMVVGSFLDKEQKVKVKWDFYKTQLAKQELLVRKN